MPDVSADIIRLAVVNDYEIVVAGLRSMLRDCREVSVVALDDLAVETGSVDIVLYDNFAQRWHDNTHLEYLVERSGAKVVVFTWTFEPTAVEQAFAAGASGYLSKGLSAAHVVQALVLVHEGQQVVRHAPERTGSEDPGAWPGQAVGLTSRESEILVLITQGLSNVEIAAAVFLSINSVKSYIRTCYRKVGVTTRAHAVRYGMIHGFQPHRTSAVQ